jgi:hypothetical protein
VGGGGGHGFAVVGLGEEELGEDFIAAGGGGLRFWFLLEGLGVVNKITLVVLVAVAVPRVRRLYGGMQRRLFSLGLSFAGVEGGRGFLLLLGPRLAGDLAGDLFQLIPEQLAVFLEVYLIFLLRVLPLRLYPPTVILHYHPFIIHPITIPKPIPITVSAYRHLRSFVSLQEFQREDVADDLSAVMVDGLLLAEHAANFELGVIEFVRRDEFVALAGPGEHAGGVAGHN